MLLFHVIEKAVLVAARVVDEGIDSGGRLEEVVDEARGVVRVGDVRLEDDAVGVEFSDLVEELVCGLLLRMAVNADKVSPAGESPHKASSNRARCSRDEDSRSV